MSNCPKVWFITRFSTGLGRALAEAVLKQGDRAIVTARQPEQLKELVMHYPEEALAQEVAPLGINTNSLN